MNGGLTLDPRKTEDILLRWRRTRRVPSRSRSSTTPALDDAYTALCEGSPARNGFFGDGLVSASRIISGQF